MRTSLWLRPLARHGSAIVAEITRIASSSGCLIDPYAGVKFPYMMRRLMAVLLSMSLLLVASVPTLGFRSMSGHPHLACAEDGHGHMRMHVADCVIECGCGCHANIDSLPHQLAPHLFAGVGLRHVRLMVPIDMPWRARLTPVLLDGEDPPPKYS